MLKNWIKKYFSSFVYFYRYLKYKVFVGLLLSLLIGVLDGFGLVMFLPLLQLASEANEISSDNLGKLGFILDYFQSFGLKMTLTTILLVMSLFFTLKGIARFISRRYMVIIKQLFIRRIRLKMIDGLRDLDYIFFTKSDAGQILNTTSGEAQRVANSYTQYFRAIEQGILVAVYMFFALLVDSQFAILVILGGGLTNLLYRVIYRRTKAESLVLTRRSNEFQGQITQFISAFAYLKSTGTMSKFYQKLRTTILDIESKNKKIGIYNAILSSSREPLMIVVVVLVILVQIKFLGGELGIILISLLFFYRALTSLMNLQNSWNLFLSVSGSLANAQSFLTDLLHNKEKRTGALEIKELKHSLELKNVSYSYDNKIDVLSNINLKILKNESIAIVGESGSGKSTLVNLLSGLFTIDRGKYLIDGLDYNKYNIKQFQRRVGYITQDPVIFSDSVFNNITLWEEPSIENVQKFDSAIQKAQIFDFVYNLPDKAASILGVNGINISGGQKQRISIARELYKNVDIFIMDEATSALDPETELAIQQNMTALMGHFTLLIVAHRLSTIRNADRIILMNAGEIRKVGTYAQLIENTKEFRLMVQLHNI